LEEVSGSKLSKDSIYIYIYIGLSRWVVLSHAAARCEVESERNLLSWIVIQYNPTSDWKVESLGLFDFLVTTSFVCIPRCGKY